MQVPSPMVHELKAVGSRLCSFGKQNVLKIFSAHDYLRYTRCAKSCFLTHLTAGVTTVGNVVVGTQRVTIEPDASWVYRLIRKELLFNRGW